MSNAPVPPPTGAVQAPTVATPRGAGAGTAGAGGGGGGGSATAAGAAGASGSGERASASVSARSSLRGAASARLRPVSMMVARATASWASRRERAYDAYDLPDLSGRARSRSSSSSSSSSSAASDAGAIASSSSPAVGGAPPAADAGEVAVAVGGARSGTPPTSPVRGAASAAGRLATPPQTQQQHQQQQQQQQQQPINGARDRSAAPAALVPVPRVHGRRRTRSRSHSLTRFGADAQRAHVAAHDSDGSPPAGRLRIAQDSSCSCRHAARQHCCMATRRVIRRRVCAANVRFGIVLTLLGAVTSLLAVGVDYASKYAYELRHWLSFIVGREPLGLLVWTALCVAFGTLAIVCTVKISPFAVGSGLPEIKSILSGIEMHHVLSFRTLFAKVLGLVSALCAGLSVGKQGPFIHIGCGVARQLSRLPFFADLWEDAVLRRRLLTAACAVGVSTTFAAPIGGVLFSIEATATYYLVADYLSSFYCAVVSASMTYLVGASSFVMLTSTIFEGFPWSAWELLAFVALGAVCGLFGALFAAVIKNYATLRPQYPFLTKWRVPIAIGVVVATSLAVYYVDILNQSERGALNHIFSDTGTLQSWDTDSALLYLAIFVLYKFVFTFAAVTQVFVAGLFAPSFAIGAGVGRLFGEVLSLVFPNAAIAANGYAVVGAAAFTTGFLRTLSTAVIAIELTRQVNYLMPALIGVITASAVGGLFNEGVIDALGKLRKLPNTAVLSSKLHDKVVHEVMSKCAVWLPQRTTLRHVVRTIDFEHSAESLAIPVVDTASNMVLIGTAHKPILRRAFERLDGALGLADDDEDVVAAVDASVPSAAVSDAKAHDYVEMSTMNSGLARTESSSSTITSRGGDGADGSSTTASIDGEATIESRLITPTTTMSSLDSRDDMLSVLASVAQRRGEVGSAARLRGVDVDALTERQLARANAVLDKPIVLGYDVPIDSSPMTVTGLAQVSRVHTLFVMLGLKQVLVVDRGVLIGLLTRSSILEGTSI